MLVGLLFAAPGGPPASAPGGDAATGAAAPAKAPAAEGAAWTPLEPGLDLGVFSGPSGASGDGKIWIVRIDPSQFELRLVNASAGDARPHTVRGWATAAGAVAGINAAMFQSDGLTSVGMMRTRAHQNNPRRNRRYQAILAFDPVEPGLAPVRILDAACGELDGGGRGYATLIQSIRMISCDRKNVWASDAKRWSTAAIGVDGSGRPLFIHARSPWPVHDLIEALLALPADVRRAMYVEGGPEAQLFVRAGGREIERRGAIDAVGERTGGLEWEIPNAVVAVRRANPR